MSSREPAPTPLKSPGLAWRWPIGVGAIIAMCGGLAAQPVPAAPPSCIMLYECDQEPVTDPQAIQDGSGNTTGSLYWYTPGRAVISTNGARDHTGAAWHFATDSSSYMYITLNDTARRIGAVGTADGLSLGFWMKGIWQADYDSNTLASIRQVLQVYASSTNDTGHMVFRFGSIEGYTIPVQELRSPPDGGLFDDDWHHLVATLDFTTTNDNLNLYVDGVPVATRSFTFTQPFGPSYAWQGMYWGVDAYDVVNGSWQGGAIDQFIVFDTALTSNEVVRLMQEGSTPFNNRPPVVAAGSNTLFSAGVPFTLEGHIEDDGLPAPPGHVAAMWTQEDGPGTVWFGNATAAVTSVRFPVPGAYRLRLTADDGGATAHDELLCTVVSNLPPVILDAGAEPRVLVLPAAQSTLRGFVIEDGNPRPPGSLLTQWSQLDGPAPAGILDPTAPETTATFTAPGRYTLRWTVDDGEAADIHDLVVTVYSEGTAGSNLVVDAGSSRVAWMFEPRASLNGHVWNASGAVSSQWRRVFGPGTVHFSSPDSLATEVTFSREGHHLLELNAWSGGQSGTDRLLVTVHSADRTFGYTQDALKTWFTGDLGITYDFEGFAFARCRPPPPAYTHPRIFINPEDLPGLRARLATTELGQLLMSRIRSTLTNELTNGTGAWGAVYDQLASGSSAGFNAQSEYNRSIIVADIAYECFRSLLDEDAAAGAKAGAALSTVAAQAIADINAVMPTNDYRNAIQTRIYRQFIGMAYDFGYPYMTEGQRSTVRQALSLATYDMWSIGLDALPAPFANTSNWVPTHLMHLLINLLAIEGETGYDENLYPRIVAAYERFLSFGVYPDGLTFEGMGKNAIIAEMLVPMAKRGDLLGAARSARNHIRTFYAQTMLPWGYEFFWDGELGGPGNSRYVDVPALKYLFPDDPAIDFVYRNELKPGYSRLTDFNRRFPYQAMDFMVRALLVEDYDRGQTWEEASAVLTNLPSGFFSNARGLMIARSDWATNAVQLYFQPRSVDGGGHAHADRNHFVLHAHGRTWAPERGGHIATAKDHSVVLVDGTGPYTLPGRVVAWSDCPTASLLAGDARLSYAKGYLDAPLTEPFTNTLNDFRLYPELSPTDGMAQNDLPEWEFSERSKRSLFDRMPMQRAFRTMALVRGAVPYVLCVDDIQRDETARQYEWRMQLPTDLAPLYSGTDTILTETNGDRRLLVRLVHAEGTATQQIIQVDGDIAKPALVIGTEAVAPEFVVLLVPHRNGDPLPVTTWNGTVLTVQQADGTTDRITITAQPDGRRRVDILRDRDGDGMPDDWEIEHGLSPGDPDDAGGDEDKDGLTNLQEYLEGYDPRDPDSSLLTSGMEYGNGWLRVQLTGRTGRRYALERSTDPLTGPMNWTETSRTGVLETDRDIQLWDSGPLIEPQAVYRLRLFE